MAVNKAGLLGIVLSVAVGLTACSGGGPTDIGPSPTRPTEETPPTGAAASNGTDGSISTGPGTTSRPAEQAAGGEETTVRQQQKPPPPSRSRTQPPFKADTRPDVSSTRQGFPLLVKVAKGDHPGYVRYVFQFTNNDPEGHQPLGVAQPAWEVRYIEPVDAVVDGSGEQAAVGGNIVLRILFDGAAMHADDGSSSLKESVQDDDALSFGSDFEGRVIWFLGLERKQPFRAFFVGGSNQVVVDIVTAQ